MNEKSYKGLVVSAIGLVFGIISSAVVNGFISDWENKLNNYNGSQQSFYANYYYNGPGEEEISQNLALYGGIKTFLIVTAVIVIIVGIIMFLKQNKYIKSVSSGENDMSILNSSATTEANSFENVVKNAANVSKQTVRKIKKYGKASIDVVKEKAAENEQRNKIYCGKCGAEIFKEQKYCSLCGEKINTK